MYLWINVLLNLCISVFMSRCTCNLLYLCTYEHLYLFAIVHFTLKLPKTKIILPLIDTFCCFYIQKTPFTFTLLKTE